MVIITFGEIQMYMFTDCDYRNIKSQIVTIKYILSHRIVTIILGEEEL